MFYKEKTSTYASGKVLFLKIMESLVPSMLVTDVGDQVGWLQAWVNGDTSSKDSFGIVSIIFDTVLL